MTNIKKAHSGAATPERATETSKSCRIDSSSTIYFTPLPLNRQVKGINRYLGVGRQNAITAERLAELAELKDPRQVTRLIERERRLEIPICARSDNTPGYFLAATSAELRMYIESLERRIKHLQATLRGLTNALDRMEGQESLWK